MAIAPGTGNGSGTLPVGRRWRFGAAVLDERSLELRVADQPVTLERKPLEVLIYLLHHAGEVVTKDELLSNVWPGRVLSETVLTGNISTLRNALKDTDHTLIKTAHGFGYRLDVEVKVEATPAVPPPPVFSFNAGDQPPLRAHWKLVERLGSGGHGEAWLGRHEKTGERRVFKFALNASSLDSLKREITLYRVLHDSLGDRVRVARIIDWNLQEAPFFIEVEYIAGRDLNTWADARGGLAAIPLEERLELVAQIADAVANAHSVGVLHKDLKPGNVLISESGGAPVVYLCDFGSGGVLDPARLSELGITKLGFTKSQAAGASGTPLYLAPEVIAGQPATIRADIYALGVILYQVVAAAFGRPLAPGWEQDVADELLREDVAASAAGNPERRLASAAELAERIRDLKRRQALRTAERSAQHRAERARLLAHELKRTRAVALTALILGLAAIVAGTQAYHAKNQAIEASESARSVSDFLMEDLLHVDQQVERPQGSSYGLALDRAASKVDIRFASDPLAAAKVHLLLGRRYHESSQMAKAAVEYEAAERLFSSLEGSRGPSTLRARERLATVLIDHGDVTRALTLIGDLAATWMGRKDVAALVWRLRVARLSMFASDFETAERELRAVLGDISSANDLPAPEARSLFLEWMGAAPNSAAGLKELLRAHASELMAALLGEISGHYVEAEQHARLALANYEKSLGDESELTASAQLRLAVVLVNSGRFDEAEPYLWNALDFYDKWLPATHFHKSLPRIWLGIVRLEQQRSRDALQFFEDASKNCPEAACPHRLKAALVENEGYYYEAVGQHERAVRLLRSSLRMYADAAAAGGIEILHIWAALAEALRKLGRADEATAELAKVDSSLLGRYPNHPATAAYERAVGLIAAQRGNLLEATTKLSSAHRILERALGPAHWRTQRVLKELQAIQSGRLTSST